MKKTLLVISILLSTIFVSTAQTHLLTFEEIYDDIVKGIAAGTETVSVYNTGSTTKILLNQDKTVGIFTLVSPSTRTFRMDSTNATFASQIHHARIRLEPNGASNATNGRKIYIDCPAPGILKVGAWTNTADRGYNIEDGSGNIISNAQAALPAVTELVDLPTYEYTIPAAGRVVINPNAGIYYGFVQFVSGGTSVNSIFENKGISFNGREVLNNKNLKIEIYNVLGKLVETSTSSINVEKYQRGVYVVRAEGVNGALKFNR